MQFDFEASRFRVTQSGSNIMVLGALTDATSFAPMLEFSGKNLTINLSKVSFASYSGLKNLISTLDSITQEYSFVEIPFDIYQVIILTEARFKADSCWVTFMRKRDGQIQFYDQLCNLTRDGIVSVAQNVSNDQVLSLSTKSYLDVSNGVSRYTGNGLTSAQGDEAAFWIDYSGFLMNTIVQCEQILGSTIVAINRFLHLIDMRVQSFSKAANILGLAPQNESWKGSATIEAAAVDAARIVTQIKNIVSSSKVNLANVMLSCELGNPKIHETLKALTKIRTFQSEISQVIDSAGAALGEVLMTVQIFSSIKAYMGQPGLELDQGKLSVLVEILGIMNPVAESDTDEFKTEIISDASSAEEDVKSCVIILQSFDLVRQILEHRTNEIEQILTHVDAYQQGDISWVGLSNYIIDALVSKMVTDQEKASFNFFLGYLRPANEVKGSSAPGDVLLF